MKREYYDDYQRLSTGSIEVSSRKIRGKLYNHKCFFILLIIIFIIEILIRESLTSISIPFILFIQEYLYYFHYIANLLSFIGNDKGITLILIISYNYFNIYESFLLILSSLSCSYIEGVLKLIYISPRPFMENSDIKVFGCEGGWGLPSGHAACSTCFYLTLYEILTNIDDIAIKIKNRTFYYTMILITLICFSRIFLGLHTINQILFGFFIGFSVYYIIFVFFEVDTKDHNQLLTIILKYKQIIAMIIILIALGHVPYLLIEPDEKDKERLIKNINNKCRDFPKAKRFENESFISIWVSSGIIFALTGLAVEFYYIFNFDVAKWCRYNFDPYNGKDKNLIPNMNFVDGNTRWNKTASMISFKRLVIVFLVCLFISIPHFFVSNNESIIKFIGIKYIFPLALCSFVMFSYLKMLCGLLGYTNLMLLEGDKLKSLLLENEINNGEFNSVHIIEMRDF